MRLNTGTQGMCGCMCVCSCRQLSPLFLFLDHTDCRVKSDLSEVLLIWPFFSFQCQNSVAPFQSSNLPPLSCSPSRGFHPHDLLWKRGQWWILLVRVDLSGRCFDRRSRGLFLLLMSLCTGTCRPCLVDVVPVKNEEGVVIMFILDFQELIDRSLKNSGFRQRVAQGWIYCNGFNIRLVPC